MPPGQRYFLWGLLLGSGIVTVIPYSLMLLLFAGQLTSGVMMGGISGAILGLTREAVAVLPLLNSEWADDPPSLMDLLPRFGKAARRLNALFIGVGALALLLTGG